MQQSVLNQGKRAMQKTGNSLDDPHIDETNVDDVPKTTLEQVLSC